MAQTQQTLASADIAAPNIAATVAAAVERQPVVDMHTHLYPPSVRHAGAERERARPIRTGLMLWGVDELLTYHYLVAEVYRVVPADQAAVRAVLEDEQARSRPTTSGSTCSSSARRSAKRAAAC